MSQAFSVGLISLVAASVIGTAGRSSSAGGRTQILAGILVVAISLVGLAVVALGLRTAATGQQRFGDDLRARHDELSALDGDPKAPPSPEVEPAAAAALTVAPTGREDGVQMLQTLSAPVLAILRARVSGDLERVKPYLVPSLYQRLGGQTASLPVGRYHLAIWQGASVPDIQAMQVLVGTKGFEQRWTLVRGRTLIQCQSCGASVSGRSGDKCPACGAPCSGFEAGWRALDMAAA
jgi:hypothetical protein